MQDEGKPAKKVKTETGASTPAAAGGSSTVFIKNMPWSATEDTIRAFFEEAGEVADIRIGAPLQRCFGAALLLCAITAHSGRGVAVVDWTAFAAPHQCGTHLLTQLHQQHMQLSASAP